MGAAAEFPLTQGPSRVPDGHTRCASFVQSSQQSLCESTGQGPVEAEPKPRIA